MLSVSMFQKTVQQHPQYNKKRTHFFETIFGLNPFINQHLRPIRRGHRCDIVVWIGQIERGTATNGAAVALDFWIRRTNGAVRGC
jgi:hypothetical protein